MADYRQYFQAVLRPRSEHAVEEFFALSGRYSNFQKETCFIRYLARYGYKSVLERLSMWEKDDRARQSGYVYVPALARQPDQGALETYIKLYNGGKWQLPFRFENRILEEAFETSFRETLEAFQRSRGRAEESIVRNTKAEVQRLKYDKDGCLMLVEETK